MTPERRIGRAVQAIETCASTNDEAARMGRAGAPEGLVVVAEQQTGGRGRLGRTWFSPAGQNLYLSILLRPDREPAQMPPLTLMTGAVIASVIERQLGVMPVLKWPNDVQLPTPGGPRKLAGILTEMASERDRIRQVVVGIGVNVNGTSFPPELADKATSLRIASGTLVDRKALLATLLESFDEAYGVWLSDGPAPALAAWRRYAAFGVPCRVDVEGKSASGTAVGIDDTGALLLRTDRGSELRIVAGEVMAP